MVRETHRQGLPGILWSSHGPHRMNDLMAAQRIAWEAKCSSMAKSLACCHSPARFPFPGIMNCFLFLLAFAPAVPSGWNPFPLSSLPLIESEIPPHSWYPSSWQDLSSLYPNFLHTEHSISTGPDGSFRWLQLYLRLGCTPVAWMCLTHSRPTIKINTILTD